MSGRKKSKKVGLDYLMEEDVSDASYGADEGPRPDPVDPVPNEPRHLRNGRVRSEGTDIEESRRHSRRGVVFDVLFERGEEHVPARGSNLSRSGMFVATRRALPKGDVVSAILQVEHREIKVIAEVVWSRPNDPTALDEPPGMGLKFLDVDESDADFIDALVSD